ncbi:MAG: hypothetical protein RLZZ398_2240 [Verrucomicrobiota bacterium]|jgi:hypothetical protein
MDSFGKQKTRSWSSLLMAQWIIVLASVFGFTEPRNN